MLFFLGSLFDDFIGKTVKSVTSAAEVKIKQKTVGKVEGKIAAQQAQATQKALRGMDKTFDKADPTKKR